MGVFLLVSTPLAAGKVLIANVIRLFQAAGNVRIGSLAALLIDSSLMAASEGKADVPLLLRAEITQGQGWPYVSVVRSRRIQCRFCPCMISKRRRFK